MSDQQKGEIPDWFKPHAEAIYLSLYALALGLKNAIDNHATEAKLRATCVKGLAASLSGPTPDLESLRAALESQHETLNACAESVKNLPSVAVQAIDRMGAILEANGIKIPPELPG